jgi:hypothetical protein
MLLPVSITHHSAIYISESTAVHAVIVLGSMQAFEDVEDMLEGPEGFDSKKSVWHRSGWREIAALRRYVNSTWHGPLATPSDDCR